MQKTQRQSEIPYQLLNIACMIRKCLSVFLLFCAVCFIKGQTNNPVRLPSEELTIATWNIGHFSRGKVDHSTVNSSNYDNKLATFRKFVKDSLNVDVLCINEFSSIFYRDSLKKHIWAETSLFGRFKEHRVFKQNRFVCNAIFSKIALNGTGMQPFQYSDSMKLKRKNIDWFYYTWSDITIGGKNVKLVCAHLINRDEQLCQNQIKQLLMAFNQFDRVIICGDMNTNNYQKFKDYGYMMVQDGNKITLPSRSLCIDNIFVKGLKISGSRVIKTKLSDHFAVACNVCL